MEVEDSFYHLVGARRMEHTFAPCYGGEWGVHLINVYAMASAETEEIRTAANRKIYAEVMRYTMMWGAGADIMHGGS